MRMSRSMITNRQATAQPPEGDDIPSQGREIVWDRGKVFSWSVAASQLRQLWDKANAERPSVDFSWPRFCWASIEVWTWCWIATSARPSTMIYKSFSASFHLIITLNTSCLLTRQQTDCLTSSCSSIFFLLLSRNWKTAFFLHHLPFYFYVQRLKVYWTSSSSHFFSMVFYGAFTARAGQSDLFVVPLFQVDWSQTVQPN